MKIHNVRLGFASNSSSAHSLIFLKDVKDTYNPGMAFGWDNFTLSSRNSKQKYLASTLYYSLAKHIDSNFAAMIVKLLTNEQLTFYSLDYLDQYIDYQSIIYMPYTRYKHGINRQFWDEFSKYILQDGLVILGGNDNEDSHPLDDGSAFKLPVMDGWARKDEKYNYWSIFNPNTGAKVRFSFDDLTAKPTKATYPELVDLKITDYCSNNCQYCYMDSNTDGKHAKKQDIYSIISKLADMEVFEISLGGGDALTHPDFFKIISWCKYKEIVPNFTTHRINWIRQPEYKKVIETIGTFSVTVTQPEEIMQLYSIMNSNLLPLNKCSVNIVAGVVDTYSLELLLKVAEKFGIRVIMLGYKSTGRGSNFKPQKCNIFEAIDNCKQLPSISVDTAIINNYSEEMKKRYPSILYDSSEGEFSCYIDAVDMKIGKSSYDDNLVDISNICELPNSINII
jgi:hypothetical protein